MKNKLYEIIIGVILGLGICGAFCHMILCLVENDNISKVSIVFNNIVFISVFLLIIGAILTYFNVSCRKKENDAVEEQIKKQLDDIKLQQDNLKTDLYRKLDETFSAKNYDLKFLQDIAASMSNKDSAWTEKQIDIFLRCMESINEMMEKH